MNDVVRKSDTFERSDLKPGDKCQYHAKGGLLNATIEKRSLEGSKLTVTLKVTHVDVPVDGERFSRGSIFQVFKDLSQPGLPEWRIAPLKTWIGFVGL